MFEILYIIIGVALSALAIYSRLNASLEVKKKEALMLSAQLVEAKRKIRETETTVDNLRHANSALNASCEKLTKELELLRSQMGEERAEQQKRLESQLVLVKEQLANATQQLLKQRSEELNQTNTQQMNSIITPLKEVITEMKTAMDNNRDAGNRNSASLSEQIKQVLLTAQNIGMKADNLADAMRGENKTQGNWGEAILAELLQSQGLKEGIHYDVQTALRDEKGALIFSDDSGKRMIPDVVLHYPDGKDVVIDSKVSLTAFLDYYNAEDDETRQDALSRHLASLHQHVKELSHKDYSKYIRKDRQSLGYVIMFVPNESALQLALCNDSVLWRNAFDNGVFITSEQNLIAALRMIELSWTQVQQAQNQERVFALVNTLLERVGEFFSLFEKIKAKIADASSAYDEADKKLRSGRQNLLAPARRLMELGAKENPKKPLPPAPESLLE